MSDLILRDRIDQIYRLRFRRSIKSVFQTCEMVKLQVVLTSEFDNVPIKSTWNLSAETILLSEDVRLLQSVELTQSVSNEIWSMTFAAPSQIGKYRIRIYCLLDTTEDCGIAVLDLWSETFEVQPEKVLVAAAILIPNHRLFLAKGESIWIKEDFGETIGSHIYDCSIILCRYFRQTFSAEESYPDLVIELGSGCGLSAIFACLLFRCRTILTDLPEQLPLLSENVNLNGLDEQKCSYQELRWGDLEAVNDIVTICSEFQNIVILAADVLYDSTAAPLLLQTVQALSGALVSKRVTVLLAQKNRDNMTVDDAQHRLTSFSKGALLSKLVRQEANVYVWDISFQSSYD